MHQSDNRQRPIISLTTDFGRSDGYVGTMEGVILGICPQAAITHLSHAIPPQNIYVGAFVLYQSFSYYPKHAVHCVVVDPGVGSQRRAVALKTEAGFFVGPDNGIFSLILNATSLQAAVSLTNPAYHLSPVSHTFHGRDIFSPAAAHLAAGTPLEDLGEPLEAADLMRADIFQTPDAGQARVIHIDHFGNVVLSLTAEQVSDPARLHLQAGQTTIARLRDTFAEVDDGELLAYVGSSRGHVEIALRNGNAAQTLALQLGDVVQVIDK